MKLFFGAYVAFFCVIFLSGCQTMTQEKSATKIESRKDIRKALGTIAGAISGKDLSEKELRRLAHEIRTDKEAQSAIQNITDAMSGKKVIKYCPVTGRRYGPNLTICPDHGVLLKEVE